MASEMKVSPPAPSVDFETCLLSKHDRSWSELSQEDIEAAKALEELRKGMLNYVIRSRYRA